MTEPTLPVRQPTITHTRTCHQSDPKSDDPCTCGWLWRIALAERDRELQQARGERDSLLAECQKLQDIVRAGDAESEAVQSALREAREEIARLKEALTELRRWDCFISQEFLPPGMSPRENGKWVRFLDVEAALHPVPEKPNTKG